MKFDVIGTCKLKCFLLIFLILQSHYIYCYNRIKVEKNKYKSKINSKENERTNDDSTVSLDDLLEESYLNDDQESIYYDFTPKDIKTKVTVNEDIKYLRFFIGFLGCMPYIGPFVYIVEKILDADQFCKISEMKEFYKQGIIDRRSLPMKTYNSVQKMIKDMPWTPILKDEKIVLDENNLKESCKKLIKARNNMLKENQKYIDSYKKALESAQEIKDSFGTSDEITFKKFLKVSNNIIIHRNSGYRNLKDYFLNHFFGNNLKEDELEGKIGSKWKVKIEEVVNILSDNKFQSELNIKSLMISKEEKISCSKLDPNKMHEEYEKGKPKVLDKLAGAWNSLKYLYQCLTTTDRSKTDSKFLSAIEKFISILNFSLIALGLITLVDIFASTVANIFGFFFLKGLKIAFWGIRAIYSIFKALEERRRDIIDKSIEYRFWGVAAGSAVRIVYTILSPTEKKKK